MRPENGMGEEEFEGFLEKFERKKKGPKPNGNGKANGEAAYNGAHLGEIITHAELLAKDFPPIEWLFEGLVAKMGLNLFVGTLKIGKSWLALQMALACSHGTHLLDRFQAARTQTLYLALEDYERRIRLRMDKLMETGKGSPIHFLFDLTCPPEQRMAALDGWLGEHPHVGFVIIDTLQRFRGRVAGKDNAYAQDTEILGELQRIAIARERTLLLVHHTRKSEALDDWLDKVLGSQGLAGAADTILYVERLRGEAEGVLKMTGRDLVDDSDLAIRFDKETCLWSVVGEARVVKRSREQQEVLDALGSGPMTAKELCQALGKKYTAVHNLLGRLIEDGLIERRFDKKYEVRDLNF